MKARWYRLFEGRYQRAARAEGSGPLWRHGSRGLPPQCAGRLPGMPAGPGRVNGRATQGWVWEGDQPTRTHAHPTQTP